MNTNPPVWMMISEAAESLSAAGNAISFTDIMNFIKSKYDNVNPDTIDRQIRVCCVNSPTRVNWGVNQKPRITDGSNKYDFLYILEGKGQVEPYRPDKHGLWEIAQRDGKLIVRRSNEKPVANVASELPKINATDKSGLHEDSIKEVLGNWLTADGWITDIAWGQERGVDILARRGNHKWFIEVKGCGSRSAMRVNYFLAILGETLQRMDDADAKYSIALPNMQQYRKLWDRLPRLAKDRTQISVIFVSENGLVLIED